MIVKSRGDRRRSLVGHFPKPLGEGGAGGVQSVGLDPFEPTSRVKDNQLFVGRKHHNLIDGAVYRRRFGKDPKLIIAPPHARHVEPSLLASDKKGRNRLSRLKMLISMRDTLHLILDKQAHFADEDIPEGEAPPWAADQEKLRKLHDSFLHAFGPINKAEYRRAGKHDSRGSQSSYKVYPNLKKFRGDPDAPLVAAIEKYDEATQEISKAPICYQRVIEPARTLPELTDVREALRYCLSELGRVDEMFLDKIMPDRQGKDIVAELFEAGAIFRNPVTDAWEDRSFYLSGNVREKLARALEAAAQDPQFKANVQALQSVLPKTIPLADIELSQGMPWLPPSLIEDFAREVIGLEDVHVHYIPEDHKWFVKSGARGYAVNYEFETEFARAGEVLQAFLNGGDPKVIKHDYRYGLAFNREDEKTLARAKRDQIETALRSWIASDPEREKEIVGLYNRQFNSYAPTRANGTHMRLPGAAVSVTPRENQRSVAWRSVQHGNTLYNHAVGAGKTFASIMAAMEQRRLGAVKKPAFVVPNHMVHQFSRDCMMLYPGANILVLDDDQLHEDGNRLTIPQKIKRSASLINDHDWDAVFMSQSFFDNLKSAPQTRLQMLLEKARIYRDHLAALPEGEDLQAREYVAGRYLESLSNIEAFLTPAASVDEGNEEDTAKSKRAVIAMDTLQKRLDTDADDPVWERYLKRLDSEPAYFEDTGIDSLIIDEGHAYKNLAIESRERGLAREGSARAANLSQIVSYLQRKNPGYYLTLMTATPVSNALSELYAIQYYMRPDMLRQSGLHCFDAWLTMFGEAVTDIEMAPEGGYFRENKRIARYKNLPELLQHYHVFADVILDEDLDLNKPSIKCSKDSPDGRSQVVYCPRSQKLDCLMDWLSQRAVRLRSGEDIAKTTDENGRDQQDNFLTIIMDGRLATLHPDLVWPKYEADIAAGYYEPIVDHPADQPGKIEALAEQVLKIYKANKDKVYRDSNGQEERRTGALQMVISDLGVPGLAGDFSVYREIKKQLVKGGIPEDKVQFIHDHNSDKKKAELFAKCRDGRVAVLMGTTEKLGTGTNVQDRLIALHHLDAPWKPGDVVQRDGRIWRPGNKNKEIEIFRYVTEGSYDIYLWQTLERKSRFINQLMRGTLEARTYDDSDNFTQLCNAIKLKASNNPEMFELETMRQEIKALETLKKAEEIEKERLKSALPELEQQVATQSEAQKSRIMVLKAMEQDQKAPLLRIGDQTYGKGKTAGSALKLYLREVVKDLRAADSDKLFRQGEVVLKGVPCDLTAAVETIERPVKGDENESDKVTREYKYTFAFTPTVKGLVHKDCVTGVLTNADIRETIQERDLCKAFAEADTGLKEEEIKEREMFLKSFHKEIMNKVLAPLDTLAQDAKAAELTLTDWGQAIRNMRDALSQPFSRQQRYEELKGTVKKLEARLLAEIGKKRSGRSANGSKALPEHGPALSL